MLLSSLYKPLFVLVIGYMIYTVMLERNTLSHFVPYNSFEVPKNMDPKDWQKLNDKFGNLIQLVNTTTFSVAYQLDNMVAAFKTVINNIGVGSFEILSVGETTPLSITNVVIQDVSTLAVTRLKRVDFVVESMNPFVISKVIITPDTQYIASQNVTPKDPLVPNLFRTKNALHLFYPYKSSDDDMMLTDVDRKLFEITQNEKAAELQKMATGDVVPAGAVATIPAMSLPTASVISKEIVGAGPLHPIGM